MATGLEGPDRDLKLRLGCSVFLSHSGADKDFVRFLHERLVQKGYRVFFDEESLPKAVPLSMTNILAELEGVKLAVLVLSNAFFTRTQHPMRELATIVAAKIQMLPIFYEFSVPQFEANRREQAWLKEWMRWVHEDVISTDTIREWEDALEVVSRTNGLEFCKEARNSLEFRDKIVARVCRILKPDLRWSAQGLQGMERLCQIVSQRFEALATIDRLEQRNSHYQNSSMILGMHGIDGIGKSSLCKALCDFFFQEFESQVCYIELGDYSTTAVQQRLEFAYTWLTGGVAPLQHLSDQQLRNLWREHFEGCGSRPVFLAIDNVQDSTPIFEESHYLSCKYPEGSKIFVTSQSEDVLSRRQNIKVEKFPHLRYSEARDIFLYTLFRGGHNTLSQQQEHVVDDCVQMCTLNKLQTDYYPLMLVVLASYMVQINRDPLQWLSKLDEIKRDGILASSNGLKPIFQCTYDSLTEDQRLMLIDLALYLPGTLNRYPTTEYAKKLWLEPTYPSLQDVDQIISKLADLSLLESRDSSVIYSDNICFRVHDLVREFVKREVSKSKSHIFMERQSVNHYFRRQLMKRQHIERLGISNCHFEDATLDLSGIENIEVLHLVGNTGLKCVRLSRMGWFNLQSLVVQVSTRIKIRVVEANMEPQAFYLQLENCGLISEDGGPLSGLQIGRSVLSSQRREHMFLESNSNSSGLTWSNLLYLSLYRVHMFEQLGEGGLGALPQLFVLKLVDLPDMRVNLSLDKCPYIREISLCGLPNLEAISGLDASANLVRLSITECNTPSSLVLLDKGASYKINECKALESIELHQSQLKDMHNEVDEGSLSVFGCPLVHISGLSQRQFIGTVSYEVGKGEKSLECTPESLEHVFENSGDSIQQQMGTATVLQFALKHEGLQELKLRDVRDLSSFLAALRRTSGSSLEDLKIICSRHDECGCHDPAHQPHFHYFKMALKVLCYSCSRVKDLSSLENCSSMEVLCLYGCVAAVKWPDFGKMTSLATLIVESPGSLVHWPSALQSHPSLDDLIIIGSNQIPPEELLAAITTMDPQSNSRRERLSSFAALEILVDDVYSGRKDKLHIAEALTSSHGKLLCIIDIMLSFTCINIGGDDEEIADGEGERDNVLHRFEARKQLQVTNMRFFHLMSQLLYGLWVEADCSLHECSLACGTEHTQMELLQNSLQGLLSGKTMISALLLTIPEWPDLWSDDLRSSFLMFPRCLPCKIFRSSYAYESLVLISFASIERFEVQMEEESRELVNEIKHIVDSFFESWERNEYGRLPLLLQEDEVFDRYKESGDYFFRYIEHQLSAVRVADAVWRLGQLAGRMHGVRAFKSRRRIAQRSSQGIRYNIEFECATIARDELTVLERRRTAKDNLGACVAEMYRKYQDMRAGFTEDAEYQDSQSVRKQWHHPVGCFCGLRRREDYDRKRSGTCNYVPHDYSVFSSDLLQLRHPVDLPRARTERNLG